MATDEDIHFMREALKEALKAESKEEVPVGAVVVVDGKIVARGHNLKENNLDPTAHAEILAIRKAARRLENWRLKGAALYVTLEPCIMCVGAMVQARIWRVVFATKDPKAGACGSVYNIPADYRLNHRIVVEEGILREEGEALLKEFFRNLRRQTEETR